MYGGGLAGDDMKAKRRRRFRLAGMPAPPRALNAADRMLLQRLTQGPVTFTYSPCQRGGKHVKLTASTLSLSQKKPLHALALGGYVAESLVGDPCAVPPHTTLTFTITGLGRGVLGPAPDKPLIHRHALLSEDQMAEDSIHG